MFTQRPVSAPKRSPAIVRPNEVAFDFLLHDCTQVPITETQLKDLFDSFDADGSGSLDREEFKRYYRNCFEHFGLVDPPHQVDELFERYDTNRDGRIHFDEFAILILRLSRR